MPNSATRRNHANVRSSASVDSRDENNSMNEDGMPTYMMNKLEEVSMFNLFIAACVANMGTVLFGFDIGASPWIIKEVALRGGTDASSYYYLMANSDWLEGAFLCASTFGTAAGYWFLLFLGNDMSKRIEMHWAALFFVLGSILMSICLANDWTQENGADMVAMLVLGHFIYGLGGSCVLHSVPQYLAEICPRQLRGRLTATVELGTGSGIVLGQVVGYFFCNSANNGGGLTEYSSWEWVFYIAAIWATLYVLFIQLYKLPTEIDYMLKNGWTSMEGRVVQYTKDEVLERIRFMYPRAHDGTVTQYKRRLKKLQQEEDNWQKVYNTVLVFDSDSDNDSNSDGKDKNKGGWAGLWRCCWKPVEAVKRWFWNNTRLEVKIIFSDEVVRRILLVGTLLKTFDLLQGAGLFMWDSVEIFHLLGDDQGTYVIGLTVVKWLTSIFVLKYVEYLPRRTWLLASSAIMAISIVALLVFIQIGQDMAAIWSLYGYLIGYQIGYGTVSWVIISEILPKFVRSAGNSIIIGNQIQLAAFFVLMLPVMFSNLGITGTFCIFLFFILLGAVFLYLFIPETRGVDLDLEGHVLAHKQYLHGVSMLPSLCCGTKEKHSFGLKKQMSSIFEIQEQENYEDGDRGDGGDGGDGGGQNDLDLDFSTEASPQPPASLNDSFGSGDDPDETTPLF